MLLFLHIDVPRALSVRQGLRDIDWIGNFLLVCSVVSILIALTWADSRYPWSSWRILVPLLVGFAGLGVFHAYEASNLCAHPTIPPRLLSNRTASIAFLITFFMGIMAVYRTYFLVVYLEGVLMKSTARAGVLLLPSVLVFVPASVVGGVLLSKTGRYKPVHGIALAFVILASGLYMDFDQNSSLAKVILYQIVAGAGPGMLSKSNPPSVNIKLSHKESSQHYSSSRAGCIIRLRISGGERSLGLSACFRQRLGYISAGRDFQQSIRCRVAQNI